MAAGWVTGTPSAGRAGYGIKSGKVRSQAMYHYGDDWRCTNCATVVGKSQKFCSGSGALLTPNAADPPYAAVSNESDADAMVQAQGTGGRGTRDIAELSWSWVPAAIWGLPRMRN